MFSANPISLHRMHLHCHVWSILFFFKKSSPTISANFFGWDFMICLKLEHFTPDVMLASGMSRIRRMILVHGGTVFLNCKSSFIRFFCVIGVNFFSCHHVISSLFSKTMQG